VCQFSQKSTHVTILLHKNPIGIKNPSPQIITGQRNQGSYRKILQLCYNSTKKVEFFKGFVLHSLAALSEKGVLRMEIYTFGYSFFTHSVFVLTAFFRSAIVTNKQGNEVELSNRILPCCQYTKGGIGFCGKRQNLGQSTVVSSTGFSPKKQKQFSGHQSPNGASLPKDD